MFSDKTMKFNSNNMSSVSAMKVIKRMPLPFLFEGLGFGVEDLVFLLFLGHGINSV